jgi:hypothetical protein
VARPIPEIGPQKVKSKRSYLQHATQLQLKSKKLQTIAKALQRERRPIPAIGQNYHQHPFVCVQH